MKSIRLEVVVIDPVVADQRVGQENDLASVAGVGQDLLVAGHAGIEDNLADGNATRAKGTTLVYGSVAQKQISRQRLP